MEPLIAKALEGRGFNTSYPGKRTITKAKVLDMEVAKAAEEKTK